MATKNTLRIALLASCCAAGLGLAGTDAEAQSFILRLDYARSWTPYNPAIGEIDSSPPYTVCAGNAITLRFSYFWTYPFLDYVNTGPIGTLFPNYFLQGITPNPALLTASQPGFPVIRQVDVGLIAGPVDSYGTRTVPIQGRTLSWSGQPSLTARKDVLIETQIPPPPVQYGEISDGTLDMPTRPWLRWSASFLTTNERLDITRCGAPDATTPAGCGNPVMPDGLTDGCTAGNYCAIGTEDTHQVATALAPATAYRYRVLGRNRCGISNEFDSTPPRPFFNTAQACFVVAGGSIPDGGVRHFDAATLSANPGSLTPDLRVTVHTDHTDVSDLRISLTKTSPVAAGPLLLMDRPSGTNCVNGKRIQAAFADGGAPLSGPCDSKEPAINGRVAPLQSLASFAPLEGSGTWRLTVEDTNVDGKSGSLLEWCLSTDPDIPLSAAEMPQPSLIMANGFE